MIGSLLLLGVSQVFDWRSVYDETALSKAIKKVVDDSIPTITTSINNNIDQKFAVADRDKFEPLKSQVADLKTQVAVLQKSVDLLERLGPVRQLKADAVKLGIKDPQIASLELKPRNGFTSVYSVHKDGKVIGSVQINYAIDEVEKDSITLVADGSVFDGAVLYSKFGPIREKFSLSLKTFTFRWTGVTPGGKNIALPELKIAILQRSFDSNTLILASGISDQPKT